MFNAVTNNVRTASLVLVPTFDDNVMLFFVCGEVIQSATNRKGCLALWGARWGVSLPIQCWNGWRRFNQTNLHYLKHLFFIVFVILTPPPFPKTPTNCHNLIERYLCEKWFKSTRKRIGTNKQKRRNTCWEINCWQVGTAAIVDALWIKNYPNPVLEGIKPLVRGTRMAGTAVTLRFVSFFLYIKIYLQWWK